MEKLTLGNLYVLHYKIGRSRYGMSARIAQIEQDGRDVVYITDTPECTLPIRHRWITEAENMGPDYGDYKGSVKETR